MVSWCKIFSVMLVAGSLAFAQYDDDANFDSEETESFSYGEEESQEQPQEESQTDAKEDVAVGTAQATGNEWDGFRYEDLGLTQWEFQQAKEEGLSRDKLTHLLELGIRLSEYLQKPWVRLGVTEEAWIAQRSQGLEDADIDRSYRNKTGDQSYAYLSLLVPSLYQWKVDKTSTAIWIDALWVASVGATTYLAVDGSSAWWYGLIFVASAHIWSFADAFFGTQWDSNPDANRFSFGITPTFDKGVAGMLQMKF